MKNRHPADRRLLLCIVLFILYETLHLESAGIPQLPCSELHYINTQLTLSACGSSGDGTEKPVPAALTPFFFDKLPVNSAGREALESIQGIGPSLAEKIIAYRNKKGNISSSEELSQIDGIGVRRAEELANSLSFYD